uniref:Type III restriction enzyme n=1 Tax=Candidatus Kentrum sp. LFY TaxID=2126342 RepID=A0A450WIH6_9GAMM|nr:MAG: type III restriction enzyme [Candidatus Kentron sp. LFY]
MELKDFQQAVLDTFDGYLDALVEKRLNARKVEKLIQADPELDLAVPDYTKQAWEALGAIGKLPKSRAGVPFSPRTDGAGRPVPSVTLKIPTDGGKTLLAAQAVSRIMGKWVRANHGFVLWIVPSESIYTQTHKALNNREHPYRQILDRAAAGRVKILEKMTPLDRRDVESHLCVMLLMLQSSNRESKESLKIFKDRGNVRGFFPDGDDFQAHGDVLAQVPNLDVYGDGNTRQLGNIIKDSLGNALRVTRPVVVMDEGHKAFSRLALETLYGFNPCFVVELSATPADRPNDKSPIYSNWLVDVRGTALDKEEMIKLPIDVTVRGDDDWRDCLRASFEHLNGLQAAADKLHAETARYIRPICLVQVERTGNDQREAGFIHAEDAREYLLTLGVSEQQIAIKTSEKNDLEKPENLNLSSPTNPIRFIITRQALQEGWDCPFAYVLCSLAPASSRNAMTQLIGRILRQPETLKTGVAALDKCYVFCFHVATRDVVEGIKKGLEQDGMSDLVDRIQEGDGFGPGGDGPRRLKRREPFRDLRIYLPVVNWVEGKQVRPLEYEQDILYRIDWDHVNLNGVAEKIPENTQGHETRIVQIGLVADPEAKDFLESRELGRDKIQEPFDPLYVVRSISDIVPNPWMAREYVETVVGQLSKRGIEGDKLGAVGHLVLETLRAHLSGERDRLAEALFLADVEAGSIQFRLRTDRHNWVMPDEITTQRAANSQELRRKDGLFVEKSLFEPVYKDDLNGYEQSVACYLDGERALRWWHRNVAQRQYALQGWRKNKIYPDFIFAMAKDEKGNEGKERLMILETKGDHLDNPDTQYKRRVLDKCAEAYRFENVTKRGDLELVVDEDTTVGCALIFEGEWQTGLSKVLEG